MTFAVRLIRVGDSSVVAEFPERIDPAINAKCVHVAQEIRAAAIPGIRDVVPTYRTVAVYFDALRADLARIEQELTRAASQPGPHAITTAATHRIPVCYGGAYGPDLGAVAAFGGISEEDAIELHAGRSYAVFMIGFVPGFAYLGVVDQRIAVPRRTTPRTTVRAGSVGIAGPQTGVYPSDTPGGWQLIGRTPQRLFDPDRPRPSVLQAGDRVQFFRIDVGEWERFAS